MRRPCTSTARRGARARAQARAKARAGGGHLARRRVSSSGRAPVAVKQTKLLEQDSTRRGSVPLGLLGAQECETSNIVLFIT